MGIFDTVAGWISGIESTVTGWLPAEYALVFGFLVYVLLITLYALLVWKFYRFLAKRDIISLNLSKYNTSPNPGLRKFFASIFYVLENIVIIPIVVIFWFAVLSLILLVLSKEQTVQNILLIAAAIVSSTRIASYFTEDLSKDLAKMFPFTILVVFLLDPNFFQFDELLFRFSEIPTLFDQILVYIAIIVGLEVVLRLIALVITAVHSNDGEIVQGETLDKAVKE